MPLFLVQYMHAIDMRLPQLLYVSTACQGDRAGSALNQLLPMLVPGKLAT